MIKIQFKAGSDRRVIALLRAKEPMLLDAIEESLDRSMLELQRRIQEKLSGEVLEHRSGKLLASVNKEPVVRDDRQIMGRVTSSAGPAFYGRIQEAGGTRTYDIYPRYKKALAFFPSGSLGAGGGIQQVRKDILRSLYARSGKQRGSLKPSKYGQAGQLGLAIVKHVVHPPLQPRPFMRTSLAELQEKIVSNIRTAVAEALRA